jgi:hypothetical protein
LTPILLAAAEETSPGCVERLEHEYTLKSELDTEWAARPVALTHDNGRMVLVLEDPGGTPLDQLLGRPMDISHFLRPAAPAFNSPCRRSQTLRRDAALLTRPNEPATRPRLLRGIRVVMGRSGVGAKRRFVRKRSVQAGLLMLWRTIQNAQ